MRINSGAGLVHAPCTGTVNGTRTGTDTTVLGRIRTGLKKRAHAAERRPIVMKPPQGNTPGVGVSVGEIEATAQRSSAMILRTWAATLPGSGA